MAKRTNSGATTAERAEAETARSELAALLPLVRLLAQDAAREAWAVRDEKDQIHDDPYDPSACP